jgi:hypothetical protein
VVAVLVDDSRSMAIQEGAQTRSAQAAAVLDRKLLASLGAEVSGAPLSLRQGSRAHSEN